MSSVLPHHVDIRSADGGPAVVEVTFDISAPHAGAAAHAVRVVRDLRYRLQELGADDVLAMREMTSIAEELEGIRDRGAFDHVRASVARLGALRSALEQYATGEHLEREGDAEARPLVLALVDDVVDLHAGAVRAALDGVRSTG